jgi:hypothetical protein
MQVFARNPAGIVFLACLTAGLILYALWRIFEGVVGLRVKGAKETHKRILRRFPPIISGCVYGLYAALNLATIFEDSGEPTAGEEDSTWSSRMLSHTYGRVIFFIVGVVMVGLFVWQAWEGLSGHFRKELRPMSRLARKVVYPLGYIGIFGRGCFFLLLGVAAFRLVFEPDIRDEGIGGVTGNFQREAWGKAVLIFVGSLLFVYTPYCVACVRYRKFIEEGPMDLPGGTVTGLKNKVKEKTKDIPDELPAENPRQPGGSRAADPEAAQTA